MTSNNTGTYNFTLEQVTKLCTMQEDLNSYVHPEWKTQGFNWNLAIIDECMEIHGHLGWKWWKQGYKTGLTESNKAQIQLEVIDILHFVLSAELSDGSESCDVLAGINSTRALQWEMDTCIWAVTQEAVTYASPKPETWADLARYVELTEQQVMETYTQKYVLNKFRQDYGYKDGSYNKVWNFKESLGDYIFVNIYKEDNEVLADIVTALKAGGHDTTDQTLLYNELKVAYNGRLNQ